MQARGSVLSQMTGDPAGALASEPLRGACRQPAGSDAATRQTDDATAPHRRIDAPRRGFRGGAGGRPSLR